MIRVPQTIHHLEGHTFRDGAIYKELEVDGVVRSFYYYVPKKVEVDAKVIFLTHGSHCDGNIMRASTGYEFEEESELSKDMIIVYPNSYGPLWNDGRLGKMHLARELGLDEVKFFEKIVEFLNHKHLASRDELYYAGFSNGGLLGYRMTQEDLFKKIVLWCITLPVSEEKNYKIEKSRVPTMIINNLEDKFVLYDGGPIYSPGGEIRGWFRSTYDSFLAISNGDRLPIKKEYTHYTSYSLNDNILIEVKEGGHVIPHEKTTWPETLGKGTRFNSIRMVLDFFGVEK